jgi:hypothetical protein
MVWIDFSRSWHYQISGNDLDALVNIFEFDFCIGLDVFFKVSEWNFVEAFKFPIFLPFFLNCVVGQVNKFILQIFKSILFAGGPNVAFLIPITLHSSTHTGD